MIPARALMVVAIGLTVVLMVRLSQVLDPAPETAGPVVAHCEADPDGWCS